MTDHRAWIWQTWNKVFPICIIVRQRNICWTICFFYFDFSFGIPRNATNVGEFYVGGSSISNANILVTSWGDKFKDAIGEEVYYTGVWTYEACLPINYIFYSIIEYNNNNLEMNKNDVLSNEISCICN